MDPYAQVKRSAVKLPRLRTRGFQPLVIARGVVSLGFAILATFAILLTGCSRASRPDPKDAVKNMFDAMRTSDSAALAANVDLAAAGYDMHGELAGPGGDTILAQEWDRILLREMTGEGSLRRRWMTDNQIVLGRSEITGDSALVEVSFLDRVTRVQYYNKMRLYFRGGRWVVTDFKTM